MQGRLLLCAGSALADGRTGRATSRFRNSRWHAHRSTQVYLHVLSQRRQGGSRRAVPIPPPREIPNLMPAGRPLEQEPSPTSTSHFTRGQQAPRAIMSRHHLDGYQEKTSGTKRRVGYHQSACW
ncbi:hypothetical protein VFPBJ_08801 [Purpureocillium lilacinum]|uniref:Uncharacterized protein n=1 Tax=Purpureocillium lilacinum TaxID=33203 RepID=A0A179GGD6_PURLI|nr:hypothetical protein VFPBJ_08801 [Purpureocillium lilacinum]